jgi:hypothetical protein
MAIYIILGLLNVFLLICFMIFIYWTAKERSSLLDRIMSQDFEQFKTMDMPEPDDLDPDEENLIDITDARDEIGE